MMTMTMTMTMTMMSNPAIRFLAGSWHGLKQLSSASDAGVA